MIRPLIGLAVLLLAACVALHVLVRAMREMACPS